MRLGLLVLLLALPITARADFAQTVVAAAQAQTRERVVYDGKYVRIPYPGGDVPAGTGVCTDVVIRAFRKGGLDLQKAVHEDMLKAFSAYPKNWGRREPDSNIDHRRVPNLMAYFTRRGAALPATKNAADYAPGDIVAWDLGGGVTHIGLVTGPGRVVHNIGRGPQAESVLFDWKIIGHYRYAP